VPATTKIDLDALQDALGPAISADVLRGRAPAVVAAIRSLPLGDSAGDGTAARALAGALLAQVDEQLAGGRGFGGKKERSVWKD
jgi:hypothetical protein